MGKKTSLFGIVVLIFSTSKASLLQRERGTAGSVSCREKRRLVVDQPSKSDLDI